MDVVDPCIYVVNSCMDVLNPCMVLLVMVNEDTRVKTKPCSACGPTVMLTVYAHKMDSDSEVGDCCKCLNLLLDHVVIVNGLID
jgi:hypothetical protein